MSDREWLEQQARELMERHGASAAPVAADVLAVLEELVARKVEALGFFGPLAAGTLDGALDSLLLALSAARAAAGPEDAGPSQSDTWDAESGPSQSDTWEAESGPSQSDTWDAESGPMGSSGPTQSDTWDPEDDT